MTPLASPKRATVPCCCCSSKRRRLAVPDVARSWASLSGELVQLIGWRVLFAGDLCDYVRFHAACSDWTSSTARPRGRGILDPRFHPCRWMMLPEGRDLRPGHPNLDGYLRFLNLSTGALVCLHLPLFDDDHILLDSTDGILRRRNHDTTIHLHPFTGDIADLPPLSSLLPQVEPHIRRLYPTQDSRISERMAEYSKRYLLSHPDVDFLLGDLTKHTHHSAWHTMHNVICGGARLQDRNLEAVGAAGVLVQVIHGGDDQVVPVECSRHLKAKLPRAELRVMDGRDHKTVVFGREKGFAEELRAFWSASQKQHLHQGMQIN